MKRDNASIEVASPFLSADFIERLYRFCDRYRSCADCPLSKSPFMSVGFGKSCEMVSVLSAITALENKIAKITFEKAQEYSKQELDVNEPLWTKARQKWKTLSSPESDDGICFSQTDC